MALIAKLVAVQVVLLLFVLGFEGASAVAVPLGSVLLWLSMLVSGRADMLFERVNDPGVSTFAELVICSIARSVAMAAGDFELGRILNWGIYLCSFE